MEDYYENFIYKWWNGRMMFFKSCVRIFWRMMNNKNYLEHIVLIAIIRWEVSQSMYNFCFYMSTNCRTCNVFVANIKRNEGNCRHTESSSDIWFFHDKKESNHEINKIDILLSDFVEANYLILELWSICLNNTHNKLKQTRQSS